MSKEYIYIFLHIPKTGGSTIRKHIEKNFPDEERLFLSYPELRFDSYTLSYKNLLRKVKVDISKLSEEEKRKIKIIYGEEVPYAVHDFFKRDARYFTVLRNADKRTISLYNFYKTRYEKDLKVGVHRAHYDYQLLINGKIPTFKKWLKDKYAVKDNSTESMVQLLETLGFIKSNKLTQGNLKKALEKFYFIGLTEGSDKDFPCIYGLLRFNKFFIRQNISEKYVKRLSKVTERILREKNKLDSKLYKEAVTQNDSFFKDTEDYDKIIRMLSLKRKLFTPITQVLYDYEGFLDYLSRSLRKRSSFYSSILDKISSRRILIKKSLKLIILIFLGIYLAILPLRSTLYVVRIYREFTKPIAPYLSEVDPCDRDFIPEVPDQKYYYNYLKLDSTCEE